MALDRDVDHLETMLELIAHLEIDWKNLYGMRNIIAHSYAAILARVVWQAVQRHLEPLKKVCQTELVRLLP